MLFSKAERDLYNDGIIDVIIWIREKYNIADYITKAAFIPKVATAREKNQLHYEIEESVKKNQCVFSLKTKGSSVKHYMAV